MQSRSPKSFALSSRSNILVAWDCRGSLCEQCPAAVPHQIRANPSCFKRHPPQPALSHGRHWVQLWESRLKERKNSCKLQLRESTEKTREKQLCSQQGQLSVDQETTMAEQAVSLLPMTAAWADLHTAHVHMQLLEKLRVQQVHRATTKEWRTQTVDWQQPPFLICLCCSGGGERKGWMRDGVFTLLFILTALVCYQQAIGYINLSYAECFASEGNWQMSSLFLTHELFSVHFLSVFCFKGRVSKHHGLSMGVKYLRLLNCFSLTERIQVQGEKIKTKHSRFKPSFFHILKSATLLEKLFHFIRIWMKMNEFSKKPVPAQDTISLDSVSYSFPPLLHTPFTLKVTSKDYLIRQKLYPV